jgi:hypothetical protein
LKVGIALLCSALPFFYAPPLHKLRLQGFGRGLTAYARDLQKHLGRTKAKTQRSVLPFFYAPPLHKLRLQGFGHKKTRS